MKARFLVAIVLLAVSQKADASTFIGPFGAPRTGTGTAASEPPPSMGGGLSKEEVKAMMKYRNAVVIAGEDELVALAVAEGLVGVGANVVIGCKRPDRVRRAAKRRGMLLDNSVSNDDDNGGSGESSSGSSGSSSASDDDDASIAPAGWRQGCEVRTLDLASRAGVYAFAEELSDENRPLHVIVNCADDVEPFFVQHAEDGWEATAAANHLGPFLLTHLLLDQVVRTMRIDATAARKARTRAKRAAGGGGRGGAAAQRDANDDGGDDDEERAPPLVARPYPAPFGKLVSLGLPSRLGGRRSRVPPAVQGLYLGARNYTGWTAYRCAHEANTLVAMPLSRMLSAVQTKCGEAVEVNIVRPPRGRWLPRPMRQLLGTANGAALTATFLASTPMRGLNGLFFDDFTNAPPWKKQAEGLLGRRQQAVASRQVYAASMARTGSPAAQWRSEATMVMRGYAARQRREAARVRARREAEVGGGGRERERREPRQPLRELDAEALLREAEAAERGGK